MAGNMLRIITCCYYEQIWIQVKEDDLAKLGVSSLRSHILGSKRNILLFFQNGLIHHV